MTELPSGEGSVMFIGEMDRTDKHKNHSSMHRDDGSNKSKLNARTETSYSRRSHQNLQIVR